MRIMLLIAVAITATVGCDSESKPVDEMRPVYGAAKRIKAATGVGINKLRFSELRIDLATELMLKTDELAFDRSKAETLSRHVDAYAEILEAYNLSAQVWDARSRVEGCVERGLSKSECVEIYSPLFSELNANLKAADLSGDLASENAVQQVWESISTLHNRADEALYLAAVPQLK